jgi:wobble nucleotide-excising tRNase
MVDNFNSERSLLIDDIWTFLLDDEEALISGYLSDMSNYEKAIKGLSRSIKSFEDEIKELDANIIEADKNITSVQPTVNEINRLLKAYGFNNFKIVPSPNRENSYQIQRPDGTLANNTLSEGEETFISFLYFLQLTKGATDVSKVSTKKILIIDDPICSLDSTILYIVSALVKNLIAEIKNNNSNIEQLFILTHNVFFHKEASFINGNADECNDVSYWIINKDCTTSTIHCYGHNNPIHTSYELLWQELKNSSSCSFITTQNIMRRIIENYFGMLGNRKYDYIKKQLPSVEEQQICDSLFYWINDGSHTIPDDLYIDSYSDSIDKYKSVFHQIFIKSGHEAHYNMMMRSVET